MAVRARHWIGFCAALLGGACSSSESAQTPRSASNAGETAASGAPGAGAPGTSTGGAAGGGSPSTGGNGSAAAGAAAAGAALGGAAGQPGASGGNAPGGVSGGTVGGSSAGAPGAVVVGPLPASCADASAAYSTVSVALDASLVPFTGTSGFNQALYALVPVTSDAENRVAVGFTREEGEGFAAVIAEVGGATISVPGAVNGGIAATNDGYGVLVFEPIAGVDERKWAAVRRVARDGSELFQTDLFRSPNLEDEGTKGAPSTSRLGYLAESDELVAYFAHTQRYDDGVRHQGGYLATLDAGGEQELSSGWFGSHNLDQRLLADGATAVAIGIGDAYPEGVFFSRVAPRANPTVLAPLASAGNGATNGQLGGVVQFGDELVIPFVTNRSVPQDLDAGTWPDIDEAIAEQIREAAENGTDVGLLTAPSDGDAVTSAEPIWVDVAPAAGARIERLKAQRYGSGELLLLAWAELTGSGRMAAPRYYTLVIDRTGAVCQPKTELGAEYAFTAGDDIVRRPDGALTWANVRNGVINVVTLVPR